MAPGVLEVLEGGGGACIRYPMIFHFRFNYLNLLCIWVALLVLEN